MKIKEMIATLSRDSLYAIFAIFRQAGLVLLEAGLNGGLYKQQPGQTTTLGAAFPTLCEKCMDAWVCLTL